MGEKTYRSRNRSRRHNAQGAIIALIRYRPFRSFSIILEYSPVEYGGAKEAVRPGPEATRPRTSERRDHESDRVNVTAARSTASFVSRQTYLNESVFESPTHKMTPRPSPPKLPPYTRYGTIDMLGVLLAHSSQASAPPISLRISAESAGAPSRRHPWPVRARAAASAPSSAPPPRWLPPLYLRPSGFFLMKSSSHSEVTDLGRSSGSPSARSQKSCASTPKARPTPKRTV